MAAPSIDEDASLGEFNRDHIVGNSDTYACPDNRLPSGCDAVATYIDLPSVTMLANEFRILPGPATFV
jgi:hypothetical protein